MKSLSRFDLAQKFSHKPDMHQNLFKLWGDFRVSQTYQNMFLSYLDNLSFNEAQTIIVKQVKLLYQKKSLYFVLQENLGLRAQILYQLNCLVDQTQDLNLQQQRWSQICDKINNLRKINLMVSQIIIKILTDFRLQPESQSLLLAKEYIQVFNQINQQNIDLKESFLNQYILFQNGFDPFFLTHYQLLMRSNKPQYRKSRAVQKLFTLNISYAYRLLRAQNKMIQYLSKSTSQAIQFSAPTITPYVNKKKVKITKQPTSIQRGRQTQTYFQNKRNILKKYDQKIQNGNNILKFPKLNSKSSYQQSVQTSKIKPSKKPKYAYSTPIILQQNQIRYNRHIILVQNLKKKKYFQKSQREINASQSNDQAFDIQRDYIKKKNSKGYSLDDKQADRRKNYKSMFFGSRFQTQLESIDSENQNLFKSKTTSKKIANSPTGIERSKFKDNERVFQNKIIQQLFSSQLQNTSNLSLKQRIWNKKNQMDNANSLNQKYSPYRNKKVKYQEDNSIQHKNKLNLEPVFNYNFKGNESVNQIQQKNSKTNRTDYSSKLLKKERQDLDLKYNKYHTISHNQAPYQQKSNNKQISKQDLSDDESEIQSQSNSNKDRKEQYNCNDTKNNNSNPQKQVKNNVKDQQLSESQSPQKNKNKIDKISTQLALKSTQAKPQVSQKKQQNRIIDNKKQDTISQNEPILKKQSKNQSNLLPKSASNNFKSLSLKNKTILSQDKKNQINNQKQKQLEKQKSPQRAKQIKMKPGKIHFSQLQLYLGQKAFQKKYQEGIKQNLKSIKKISQNTQTYLMEFFINDQVSLIALCSPTTVGDIIIHLWGPIAQKCNQKSSTFFFNKYLQYLQKNTTSKSLFYKGNQIPQLNISKFQKVKQRLYTRKRVIPITRQSFQFQPFLSYQISNLYFQLPHSQPILYSEQIQPFTQANSFLSEIFSDKKQKASLNSQSQIIFNQNIKSLQQINLILEKDSYDTYQIGPQIKASGISMSRMMLQSGPKNGFICQQGYMIVVGNYFINANKQKKIFRMEMSKNVNIYFFKDYEKMSQIFNEISSSKEKKYSEQIQFGFKMFSKQLYGQLKFKNNEQVQFYGNWDINFAWRDQIQGKLQRNIPKDMRFGPQSFFTLIEQNGTLLFGFQVKQTDFLC